MSGEPMELYTVASLMERVMKSNRTIDVRVHSITAPSAPACRRWMVNGSVRFPDDSKTGTDFQGVVTYFEEAEHMIKRNLIAYIKANNL